MVNETKWGSMRVIDYNGSGRWSCTEVQQRYVRYAADLKVSPRDLTALTHSDRTGTKWISPIMDKVIEGIESGDAACVALGIDFIEEDERFPFGRVLKSNTARALRRSARRAEFADEQAQRIRVRVFAMLRRGHVPREYREYAKLLRAVGFDRETLMSIDDDLDHANPYVMRFYRYFERVLDKSATSDINI